MPGAGPRDRWWSEPQGATHAPLVIRRHLSPGVDATQRSAWGSPFLWHLQPFQAKLIRLFSSGFFVYFGIKHKIKQA